MKTKPDRRMKSAVKMVALCIVFVTPFACLKNNDKTSAGPKADLLVTNFVLNAAPLDVDINEVRVNTTALSFGNSSGITGNDYSPLAAGTHVLQVFAATKPVLEKTIRLEEGRKYSLVFYDSVKNDLVKAVLLTNDTTTVDSLGKVRFINFVPGEDTLTAIIYAATSSLSISERYIGLDVIPDPDRPFIISLRPGTYRVELRKRNALVYEIPSFSVSAGKLYSWFAKGVKDGTGIYKESLTTIRHN